MAAMPAAEPPESAHHALLLLLARGQELAPLLAAAVDGLAAEPESALVRVWLVEGSGQRPALGLAASAGHPRAAGEDWTRPDGHFGRFRLGHGKIGRIARAARPLAVPDLRRAPRLLARPAWARREAIRSFAGLPLISCGRVEGVMAVFRRDALGDAQLVRLARVADHVAAAVARARRLAELALRREAAEREADFLREELLRARAGTVGGARPVATRAELRQRERENLEAALRAAGGRIYGPGGAAALLGVPPTTLASRMKALGVARTD
jgi:GAF domain-containing protein